MADVGRWAIALTLLVSAYTALASILGARRRNTALIESARNGALVTAASATIASAMLISLLLNRDYGIRYVYQHVDRHLPVLYTLSAFWAGQEGSLLLWLWFVTLLTAAVVLQRRTWDVGVGLCTHPYVLAAMALTQGFLALVLLLPCNPFARLPMAPVDGLGLNPLLQNPWMVIHPPVVFMGYAAYTVPFALALGGLVTGQRRVTDSLGQDWLPAVRRWALLAWLFLGAGIWMGAWWAYVELGWGGYWGWDPVENASLIPWLTGTALLHSLRMQRRYGAFRTWNLWLIALTFVLCVLATTITRSGLIESVHAFGRSPVGYSFIAWIALCMLAFVVLLSMRRREVDASASDWVNPSHPTRLLSRRASLLLTNLLLGGTALVVLVGTLFPALSEALRGRPIALGTSFYERTVGPLLQAVILLMGVCPWLAWGGSAPAGLRRKLLPPALAALAVAGVLILLGVREAMPLFSFALMAFVALSILAVFYRDVTAYGRRTGAGWASWIAHLLGRNRRRYGAHVVHLGIVLIAIGVAGSSIYGEEAQVVLAPGEHAEVSGYTLVYQDFLSEETPTRQQFTAVVRVQRGKSTAITLQPRKDFYWNVEQWVTEVAIRSTLREDLYLILAGFEEDGLASFYVWINPLVAWLWIGGAALLLGGTVAWWPSASLRGKSANNKSQIANPKSPDIVRNTQHATRTTNNTNNTNNTQHVTRPGTGLFFVSGLMLLALYLLVLSPSLCVPLRLCASALRQGTLRGQVVNGTAGGGPTASLAVTLRAFRGDQESQRLAATADALGQFHFAHLETGADWTYQVQVTYQRVTYSGSVLSFAAGQDEIATEIAVYETTDSAERIGIERAHILITPSDRDREASAGLSMAEFYVLANPTDRTYVGGQEMGGQRWVSWFSLPPGSRDLAFDDGAPGGRFLAIEGGFVDTEPLWPGSTRVLFSYVLDCPAGDCDLSRQILYPIANLNVLLPDAGMQVTSGQLTLEGSREAQGQRAQRLRYMNYAGHDLAPGGMLDLHVRLSPVPSLLAPSSLGDARSLLWIILGSLAAALVLAYPFWQQRRVSQATAQGKE